MSKYKRCQILFAISVFLCLSICGIEYTIDYMNINSTIISKIEILLFSVLVIAQMIFVIETFNLSKFSKFANICTIIITAILVMPVISMFNENNHEVIKLMNFYLMYIICMGVIADKAENMDKNNR